MDMDNNDILIRLRYALDIKDTDMVKIFKLGEYDVTREEVRKILIKTQDSEEEDVEPDDIVQDNIPCNHMMLESFLNGLIIHKRGKQESESGQTERPPMMIKGDGSVNNVLLKKLRIALTLTSEDIIDRKSVV